MKKSLTFVFLFCVGFSAAFSQDCNSGYFAFKKGTKMQLTSYDKKDKVTATINYEVKDAQPVSGGMKVMFANETYDAKGNLLSKGDVSGQCVNGEFMTDVRNISSDMMPKTADMEVIVSGDQLVYPHALTAGQKLKDASINVKSSMKSMGMTLMNMTINITDRKVEGFESVETPAGKFDCVKISYITNFKLMGNRTAKSVEYVAKGVGMVKSEQYDDKDRKMSSLVLTKLEK
jgi:hypothetical protein